MPGNNVLNGHRWPSLLGVGLCLICAGVAAGQTLYVLKDGTKAEGRLAKKAGRLRLMTPFGARVIKANEIAEERSLDNVIARFKDQLSAIPVGFVSGHVALMQWAYEQGYSAGVRQQLLALLKAEFEHPKIALLTKDLAARWELDPREHAAKSRDRRAAVKELFVRVAPRGWVEARLIFEKLRSNVQERDVVLRMALDGLKRREAPVRWLSAALLSDFRKDPRRIFPLFKRSLLDPEPVVRRQSVQSLAVTKDPVFVRLFAKNLDNPKQALRMTAADALGELGLPEAITPLIAALKASSGRGTRNNITSRTSRAYVKDFDVEIAQAAVIADPVVDVVSEGVVLDVAVVGISVERGTYRRALSRLSGGLDLGDDWKRWSDWAEARSSAEDKLK